MPNTLSALPASVYTVRNDPTVQLSGDPMGVVGKNPYAEMTEAILFGAVNNLLEIIDDVTGLDLLGMIQPLEDLFGGGSGNLLSEFVHFVGLLNPVNLLTLVEGEFSSVKTEIIGFFTGGHGLIPVGSLTPQQPNLSLAPSFGPGSILNESDWTVDMSTSRSSDGTGSAKLVCDGHFHALRSGASPDDVLAVTPGSTVTETIYCRHTSFLSTVGVVDAPIQLQLALYTATGFARYITIDSYFPTAATVAWPGHTLSGSYTVESDVVGVQRRIFITNDALSGTLWVDDEKTVKGNLIQKGWIEGLEEDLNATVSRWQSLVDTVASEASGIPIIGGEIADVAHALNNFNPLNVLGTLGANSLTEDLQQILSHIVAGAKNKPVSSTATASLAEMYNAVNQAINNGTDDVTKYVDTTTVIPVDGTTMNYIDVVGIGRGQDGENGGLPLFYGQGGNCGKINATTWTKGTHYDGTLTSVTVTFNSDGSVTFSIPGHTLTAVMDPVSESPHLGSGWQGIGHADPFVYNGKSYALGGTQNKSGNPGLKPGGGGAGGSFLQHGGAGAGAGAWVRARVNAVSDPSTGPDVTAPSSPTPHVISATNTSITISASGSVDA